MLELEALRLHKPMDFALDPPLPEQKYLVRHSAYFGGWEALNADLNNRGADGLESLGFLEMATSSWSWNDPGPAIREKGASRLVSYEESRKRVERRGSYALLALPCCLSDTYINERTWRTRILFVSPPELHPLHLDSE